MMAGYQRNFASRQADYRLSSPSLEGKHEDSNTSSIRRGGSAETFVGCVNTDLSKDKWEVVFAFRAGFKGADPLGTYTRIILDFLVRIPTHALKPCGH
jgi:hypothetical protein